MPNEVTNTTACQTAITCRLFDKMANQWINYTGATYTWLDGMYGCLSVDVMTVKFFWYNRDAQHVSFDDVTDRFKIEYVFSNGM
jgi:hypothetical protein